MVIGKSEHRPILMPSGWDIQPFVHLGRIEEDALVDTVLILVNKRPRRLVSTLRG
jgi:hypothetical protein